MQSKDIKFSEYIFNTSNLIDIYSFICSVWIITVTMIGYHWPSMENQRMMAAFSVLFLWMKLIEWFKIFDATSFYVKLVRETIIEILSFALIFITCLAMFGTFMYFLQLNQKENGKEIVENKFDHFFLDILYN